MSNTTYNLLIDWDRDGFFCQGVLPSDPLNLIPNPVTWNGLPFQTITSGSTAGLSDNTTSFGDYQDLYGTQELFVDTGGDSGGGVYIGRDPNTSAVATIAVLPLTDYVVRVAVRLSFTVGTAQLTMNVRDQNNVQLGALTFTPSTIYATHDVTFTTLDSSTFIFIGIRKSITDDQTAFFATGVLMVPGSTAPDRFNAGALSNAYDDIISLCESITASYGIPQYTEAVAPAASMTVIASNVNGELSPENPPADRSLGAVNTVAPVIETAVTIGTAITGDDGTWRGTSFFSRGVLARLQAVGEGSPPPTYHLWIGTLDSVTATVGAFGERRATLTFTDPTPRLSSAQYYPALMEDVTTDEALSAFFDAGELAYPYPGAFWLLGVPGASELGVTTRLYQNRLTDFDTGDTTLVFAGDTTGSGRQNSALEFIRDIVYAELGGRFFWDAREAVFKFFKRTRDIFITASASAPGVLELDDPPEYVWGDDVRNNITLTYYPRVVGAVDSVMYSLGNLPMTLSAGQNRNMTIRYQVADAPFATIAGKDMRVPVPAIDYTANFNADGSGSDATDSLTVICTFNAISADLTLINNSVSAIYIQTFQLRGTPLVSLKPVQTTAVDGASIIAQGEFKRTLDLPALGDATLAESYANYLVQRYKTPIGRIGAASFWVNRGAQLDLSIGDHVLLADSFLGNAATSYVVTAITHTITPTRSHWMRLTVEPLDRNVYWILGDPVLSVLGVTTRLGI